MSHLGWATTPFVDDELDPQTREQVLVHLLLCTDCRRDVEGLRRLKDAVRGLPAPPPPGSLASRLSLLGELGPLPEPRRRVPSYPSFVPPSVLAVRATAQLRAVPRPSVPLQRVRLDRERLRRSALQGALVVIGLGGALALGAPPAAAPSIARPAEPASPQVVDLSMLTATPGRPSRLQVVSAGFATRP